MPSATDFLPSHINELMNLVTIVELYRGSGRTSRLAATLLLGIDFSDLGFVVSGYGLWLLLRTRTQEPEATNLISWPERLPSAVSHHILIDFVFVPGRRLRPKFHEPRDSGLPANP